MSDSIEKAWPIDEASIGFRAEASGVGINISNCAYIRSGYPNGLAERFGKAGVRVTIYYDRDSVKNAAREPEKTESSGLAMDNQGKI